MRKSQGMGKGCGRSVPRWYRSMDEGTHLIWASGTGNPEQQGGDVRGTNTPPSQKLEYNLQVALTVFSSSVSTVPHLWIQPMEDPVVLLYIYYWKNSSYKWTYTVQTHVVQRSIVLIFWRKLGVNWVLTLISNWLGGKERGRGSQWAPAKLSERAECVSGTPQNSWGLGTKRSIRQ